MKKNPTRFSLISPSTKALYREGKALTEYSLWDFIHGYVYGRWPYLYIGIGRGYHPIAKIVKPILGIWRKLFPKNNDGPIPPPSINQASGTIADGYHGKVTPLAEAKRLVTINEPISVGDLEQVIPFVRARTIIQENPDKIVVIDCPCRSVKPDHCLPLDVCLVIGEPFASFVNEHHPDRSRWTNQEEAIRILEEEDARGHVHHAFFKDAMLGRFYAICNCCSCCCGAINAHKNGTPMLASSGYVAEINKEACLGCFTCGDYCQFGAIDYSDGVGQIDNALCMGCGICVDKCPEEAITLRREPSKGIPLEIHKLMEGAAEHASG
ncbi:MAG: 4Fe-4S binding protein [Anaerolineales bacterium]|jgi:Pyruvate/2-oxoacid:ferredoxin oxidoreductase delta subunit